MALETLDRVVEQIQPVDEAVLAGTPGKGDYHCADCGYGIAVFRALPSCPMCRSDKWLPSRWSPFRRSA